MEPTNHDLHVVLSAIAESLDSIDKTLAHELGGDLGNLRRISKMLSGIDSNTFGIEHELEEFNAFNAKTR